MIDSDRLRKALGILAIALATNLTSPARAEEAAQARCRHHEPLRRAWFGDLHVHTSFSSDAWMFDVRLRPNDAYRYAFGETTLLPPNDAQGEPTRPVRIDRPLDFAAATDHAEFLGEGVLCLEEDSPGYDSSFCEAFRAGEGRTPQLVMQIMLPFPWRNDDVCGDDGELCAARTASTWQETIRAAEAWNDTSPDCRRTAFVAYEYSSFRLGSNLHRNVIFRSAQVPELPTSYIEASREWELWDALKRDCLDRENGCDVLAIPHNSNISNGRMFAVDYPETWSHAAQQERARLRARLEPVVEIMQHKGDSECRNGVDGVLGGADELCDFEKFENLAFTRSGKELSDVGSCYDGPLADYVPHLGPNCISRLSYVRYALIEGMQEEARLGVNPFKLGITASTDTHNALAGGVEERSYPGHLGVGDDTLEKRASYSSDVAGNASNNPGGLIGVWAEENSRDSLFRAIRRKEVFGTSGPRIVPRLFGAWDYPADLCDDPNLVARADADGVPMGSDLPDSPAETAGPTFLVTALRDPGTPAAPGGLLQRIQVIKGWADEEGNHHQQVIDVAGSPDNGASVDLDTCAPRGPGHASLCAVWRDPEFDPDVRAVYYARAVENPSCRYTAWQCALVPDAERPETCDTLELPKTLQERAWTSPIWYTPPAGTAGSNTDG
jgi:hypothetical protein